MSSSEIMIHVASDFSPYPAGRTTGDGPFSGEKFRTSFLVPAIEAKETATLVLDGTRGYGSSFLEEAFGGLVRAGFSKEVIHSHIKLRSKDEALISEINEYIDQAVN